MELETPYMQPKPFVLATQSELQPFVLAGAEEVAAFGLFPVPSCHFRSGPSVVPWIDSRVRWSPVCLG